MPVKLSASAFTKLCFGIEKQLQAAMAAQQATPETMFFPKHCEAAISHAAQSLRGNWPESPATILAHELAHAAGHDASPTKFNKRSSTFDRQYDDLEERRVITSIEHSVSRLLGELPRLDHRANAAKGINGFSRKPGNSSVIGFCP